MIRYKFINSFIDCISLDNVVDMVKLSIERNIKTHIVFLNAYKIYVINRNPDLAKAISEAELILADGVPIVWASRLLSIPLQGRVNGTDLFERLLYMAEGSGKRVFLLGSSQKNVELLVKQLRKLYPNLVIAGYRNGYFSDRENMEVISQINKSCADILFLGIGSPKKEIWLHKHKNLINVPVFQGVGGSFDLLAGVIPRAPVWMQNNGLEWFFRVMQEPKRMFGRYLVSNAIFVVLLIRVFLRKAYN